MTSGLDREPQTVEEVIRHRLSTTLGGWRGPVETALPYVAFVIVWTATKDLRGSLIAAVLMILVEAGVRIAQKQTLRFVAAAMVAIAFAAFFALRSGQAEDAFIPGLLQSSLMALGSLVSILVRWPVVGFMIALGDPKFAEEPTRWRKNQPMVQVCIRLTWVLFAMFLLRFAVMLPLWMGGWIATLAVVKIFLGWPLYVLCLAVMGVLILGGNTPLEPENQEEN